MRKERIVPRKKFTELSHQLHVVIPGSLYLRLKDRARRERKTMGFVVQQGLEKYLGGN